MPEQPGENDQASRKDDKHSAEPEDAVVQQPTEIIPPPEKREKTTADDDGEKQGNGESPRLGNARERLHSLRLRLVNMLDTDIEEVSSRGLRLGIYWLKVIRESIRMTGRDQVMIRAQALSYKTILSLIPIITVMLAILSIPQLENQRDKYLDILTGFLLPSTDNVAEEFFAVQARKEGINPVEGKGKDGKKSETFGEEPGSSFKAGEFVFFPLPAGEKTLLPDKETGYGLVVSDAESGKPVTVRLVGARLSKNAEAEDTPREIELDAARVIPARLDKTLFELFRKGDWLEVSASIMAAADPGNSAILSDYDPDEDIHLFLQVEEIPLGGGNGFYILLDTAQAPERRLRVPMTFNWPPKGWKYLGNDKSGRFKAVFLKNINKLTGNYKEIGLISFLALIYTVYLVLRAVEESFNHIWEVTRGRAPFSRLALYTAIFFWGPVLSLLSVSATAMIINWVPEEMFGLRKMLIILPVGINSMAFAVVYRILPNTKVRWRGALAGGLVAGALWEICKQGFGFYVIKFASYDKVYGSLGLLPILMIWIWLNWFLILLGGEVAFVIQNFRQIEQKASREKRALEHKLYFAMRVMLEIARRFKNGRHSEPVIDDLSEDLEVPEYTLRSVCDTLVEKGLILPTSGKTDSYVPARELTTLSLRDVLEAVRGNPLTVAGQVDDEEHHYLDELFAHLSDSERKRTAPLTFDEMLEQLSRRGVGTGRDDRARAETVRAESVDGS